VWTGSQRCSVADCFEHGSDYTFVDHPSVYRASREEKKNAPEESAGCFMKLF